MRRHAVHVATPAVLAGPAGRRAVAVAVQKRHRTMVTTARGLPLRLLTAPPNLASHADPPLAVVLVAVAVVVVVDKLVWRLEQAVARRSLFLWMCLGGTTTRTMHSRHH